MIRERQGLAGILLTCILAWGSDRALAEYQPGYTHLNYGSGCYYPGPYYSRAYLQPFELRPGERPVYYRLKPYTHYGERRLGVPYPGLTDGTVQSDRFPYRYQYGFQPYERPKPMPRDECAERNKPSGMSRGHRIPATPR